MSFLDDWSKEVDKKNQLHISVVIKTATIEELKQNTHVQGLLETLKEIEKSRYSPIGDDGDFQTPDAEMARAKLKEWE